MKKQRKGFSITVETKETFSKNTVYLEEKVNGKVIFCNIHDEYLGVTFIAKAVCNEQDTFSKQKGYELAFERCLEKRNKEYDKILKNSTKAIISMKRKSTNIDNKFTKFLESVK